MRLQRGLFLCLGVVALAALLAAPALAALVSVEAFDNATVQPLGPRTGTSGKNFFNMEGSANGAGGAFASFGVADFVFPAPGGPVTGVTGATLKLTQSNAAFSVSGPLSFYLTDQTGVSIQPSNTSLNYVLPNDGAASVDSDLTPIALLGSGTYTNAGVGMTPTDSFALSFTGGALTSLLSAINGGTPLRLVITPDTAATAATYAGFSNATLAGPTLELTTIPEPSTLVLVGLVALGLAGGRLLRD